MQTLRRAPATTALVLAMITMFGVELALGGATDPDVLVRLGAVNGALLARGELYRLLCAELLHFGWLHLVLNLPGLWVVGAFVEMFLGWRRLLVAFVVTAASSSVASSLLSGPIAGSVGVSGAIMGLVGLILGAAYLETPPLMGARARRIRRSLWWSTAMVFGMGAVATWFGYGVDNAAHAGGMVSGGLLSLAMRRPGRVATPGWSVAAALSAAALGVSVLAMAAHGPTSVDLVRRELADAIVEELRVEPPRGVGDGVAFAQAVAALWRAGDDAGALAVTLELAPRSDAEALSAVTGLLHEAGVDPAAGVAAERWVHLAPGDPQALNALAWHLVDAEDLSLRDPSRARGLALSALDQLDRDDPEASLSLAAYLDTLAVASHQLGRLEEAVEFEREAVELAQREGMPFAAEFGARLEAWEAELTSGRAAP